MKNSIFAIAILFWLLGSCKKEETPRVLVFSKTAGFRHQSIGTGKLAMIALGKKNGFEVDTTEDATLFNEDNLKRYRAVLFLNTTQDVLNSAQQADFKRYIEAGGGFVGIHAAADTEYEWPWYGNLVGAYFKSHPRIQEAKLNKVRPFGPNTLPDTWTRTDEWYNFKKISDDINVIYTIDETSYEGGVNGTNHPIAWYHEYKGGRSFYTALGHTDESYADSLYLSHVLDGIRYAMGEQVTLDYSKAKTKRAIEENRFTKTVLDFNLDEPTELTVLPDGRIIFVERKGNVKLHDPKTNKTTVINTIDVWTKFEDGLIGLTSDPDFAKNNFLYIFYSHPERSANVLSRFTFVNDKIDLATEKELLEVATQRDQCCHTGGSLQFAKDRILFISTGDNSSPFKSDGFSPSDEQPGRSAFDAQKSSSNTNDLRGKILRITVNEDGSYTVPDGNLFKKGEPNTRPEIYVMGNRNPYRISVDARTGYLYWGEVGPDAGNDDSLRGPRGYDEINQAKKSGFFGWPYFIGNNYAYARYDFGAQKVNERWDPSKPINESPNNTGKRELPPATPAFIWYPYTKSEDFPMMGQGGRNAMAGPIYYSNKYNGVDTAFPDYFDGKLLIYDWIRNWMFHVTMDETGAIEDIEPFMSGTSFNNIIDMEYGPDGRLYMIEYGTGWFKQNLDARLVRIDYNGGNRAPVAELKADKTSGEVPLHVRFSAEGSLDYDGDDVTYELEAAGKNYTGTDSLFNVTFDKPGSYTVTLIVKDVKGVSSQAQVRVVAGNEPPKIAIDIVEGNQTFFFPGTPVKYAVSVTDKEDGSSSAGEIKAEDVTVTFDYLKGFDMTAIAQGHQMPSAELPGKSLIDKSDCKSCHLIDQRSAGPSYREVANKYQGQAGAVGKLAEKVIKGGSGVWGNIAMAAHPQVSVEDAKKMVEYILTLNEESVSEKLPLSGTVVPGKETEGAYILTATYRDKGAKQIPSLSATHARALRNAALMADHATELKEARIIRADGRVGLENIKHNAHAMYKSVDLTGIKKGTVLVFLQPENQVGGEVELRLNSPGGELWGTVKISGQGMLKEDVKLQPVTGLHDLYVVFKNPEAGAKTLFYFSGIQFHLK